MNPTVTVVIPVYNVEPYIERCIRSVMGQTLPADECIIVDDASPDDSIDICERLIGKYDGPTVFKILRHQANRGLSAARNTGTAAAAGDYLYYLDSDDEITPDCLEKLVAVARANPEAEMISGNFLMIHGDEQVMGYKDDLPAEALSNSAIVNLFLQNKIYSYAWNKLMRLSLVSSSRLDFKEGLLFEDILWQYNVAMQLQSYYFLKDVTYKYYKRPGSLSTSCDDHTCGVSYGVIYGEILRNLYPGKEVAVLNRFTEGFCNKYISYNKTVATYKPLMKEYKRRVKQYGCRLALWKLRMTSVLGVVPSVGKLVLPVLYRIKGVLTRR